MSVICGNTGNRQERECLFCGCRNAYHPSVGHSIVATRNVESKIYANKIIGPVVDVWDNDGVLSIYTILMANPEDERMSDCPRCLNIPGYENHKHICGQAEESDDEPASSGNSGLLELTPEEEKAIASLKRLAKKWPKSLLIFANGLALSIRKGDSPGAQNEVDFF